MLLVSARWQNWARTESSQPATVIAPESIDHVVRAVERARETGHTVKPIGASHSFTAIGATDGIRIELDRMQGMVSADLTRGRVTLWGGTRLWQLPDILDPLGLALENMGDIDRQTITGATQTGTHGTGLGFGGLASRVVGATLVTGTGEVLTVSETENAELLPAVALGLGALGVLVTVTIQCVPSYLLHAVEAPAPFEEVLESYEQRCRDSDHFEFYWFPHTEGTRTKTNTRMPVAAGPEPLGSVSRFVDEELVNNAALAGLVSFERWVPASTPALNRMIEQVSSRRSYRDLSHRVFVTRRRVKFREMEYSVPLEAVPTALRELRALIERRDYRISFPIEVRAAAADDRPLSTASGRESGYIAVHRYFRDPDREYFREAEAILAAHEGRPHWGKMHTQDAGSLSRRYPGFDRFVEARERLDPDRVFANPYLRRVLGA
ncbi:FAD-linked oxidoreductase [Leucobacter sp. OLJS4]|uniref:D-arabinono-1,4-lactone oxidase n=1 Tax=unclassified Leucobacter TaxID=2621730 RepID=UPI000C1824E3|nr:MULTISPECIES: D-arabinono-1,4-lactone oxidase [unclassified Leucobacter]PII87562.1 FAD-linked oxidoreductase [Leucobacter sp. OLCALW19]PII93322.1 FAD-linked oxidoreductase [Leucobacter sp. OLAS13]PII96420.1 FAD-linked oxidoreductase [Leucobacter sp. OLTLW20]PII99048.1 FAD-linked oxidoreductase [Leucobacter sp. OLDS2]PIJ01046.1 FAD-linked oxidoreductase [Leucobacter sp. OLCS4]